MVDFPASGGSICIDVQRFLELGWSPSRSHCHVISVFRWKGDSRSPQGHGTPLMVSFPYHSHIFRDSYGSGMGIVWERGPIMGVWFHGKIISLPSTPFPTWVPPPRNTRPSLHPPRHQTTSHTTCVGLRCFQQKNTPYTLEKNLGKK